MSYSFEEMKAICLRLAEQAESVEADALREIAKNYDGVVDEPRGLSVRQILVIAAAAYTIFTPVFLALHFAHVPPPTPKGEIIEQLSGFQPTDYGWYITRTYRLVRTLVATEPNTKLALKEPEDIPLTAYEDDRPLDEDEFWLQPLTNTEIWRLVKIRPRDGSNPNANGRKYYLVLRNDVTVSRDSSP